MTAVNQLWFAMGVGYGPHSRVTNQGDLRGVREIGLLISIPTRRKATRMSTGSMGLAAAGCTVEGLVGASTGNQIRGLSRLRHGRDTTV